MQDMNESPEKCCEPRPAQPKSPVGGFFLGIMVLWRPHGTDWAYIFFPHTMCCATIRDCATIGDLYYYWRPVLLLEKMRYV